MQAVHRRERAANARKRALAGNQVFLSLPLGQGELMATALRDHLALAELRAGRATADAIGVLRWSARMSARLTELGVAADEAPSVRAAAEALDLAEPGPVDQALVHAVSQVIDLWDAQRRIAPRGRVLEAAGVLAWK